MSSDELRKAADTLLALVGELEKEPAPWPPVPQGHKTEKEFELARYNAALEDVKAQRRDRATALVTKIALEHSRQDLSGAAEDALRASVQSAYLDVAKGTIDRSLKRAEFVTAAAGAIGTSYAALLALAFSVSADTPHPLPARGLAPAVFLAVSFLMSVIYVAFLRGATVDLTLIPSGGSDVQERRLTTFLKWVNLGLLRRTWALRTAVISLGAGVALLPLPFLDISSGWARVCIALAAGAVMVWIGIEIVYWFATRNERPSAGVPTPTLGR
jgi:hypothetical protein